MNMRPNDQFHVGIVVDDFEGARRWLTETFGYEWGLDIQLEYTLLMPTGSLTFDHRLQYSVNEPRLELIQSVKGTPLQPSDSGLHHLGYWCDDVEASGDRFTADGWTWECGGSFDDGGLAWGYYLKPGGSRIELVSKAMQSGAQSMWAPISTRQDG
jgi:catechol 2,3-dioxygenase-like lactoylglutathione lyase family enzyme